MVKKNSLLTGAVVSGMYWRSRRGDSTDSPVRPPANAIDTRQEFATSAEPASPTPPPETADPECKDEASLLGEVHEASNASESSGTSQLSSHLSLYRRLIEFLRPVLRPFAGPFLRHFEFRVQRAVLSSGLLDGVNNLDRRISQVAESHVALQNSAQMLLAMQTELGAKFGAVLRREGALFASLEDAAQELTVLKETQASAVEAVAYLKAAVLGASREARTENEKLHKSVRSSAEGLEIKAERSLSAIMAASDAVNQVLAEVTQWRPMSDKLTLHSIGSDVSKPIEEISERACSSGLILEAIAQKADGLQEASFILSEKSDLVVAQIESIHELGRALKGTLDALSSKADQLRSSSPSADNTLAARLDSLFEQEQLAIGRSEQQRSELLLRLDQIRGLSIGLPVAIADNMNLLRSSLGFIAVAQDDPATTAYMASGAVPEKGSISIVRALLEDGDGFIDVGANVGVFTLAAAQCVGPNGRVLAFEPAPSTFRALEATVLVNGLRSVSCHQVAIGRRNGRAKLHLSRISGHNSLYPLLEASGVVPIEVKRLDDLTEPGSTWSAIKIDVEGAELDVLSGMKRLIRENRGLVILAEFGPSHIRRAGITCEKWLRVWSDAGFVAYRIDEEKPVVVPFKYSSDAEVFSVNLLLCRDPARISALLK